MNRTIPRVQRLEIGKKRLRKGLGEKRLVECVNPGRRTVAKRKMRSTADPFSKTAGGKEKRSGPPIKQGGKLAQ